MRVEAKMENVLWCSSGVGKLRPAGRMRPPKAFCITSFLTSQALHIQLVKDFKHWLSANSLNGQCGPPAKKFACPWCS